MNARQRRALRRACPFLMALAKARAMPRDQVNPCLRTLLDMEDSIFSIDMLRVRTHFTGLSAMTESDPLRTPAAPADRKITDSSSGHDR